MSGPCRDAQDVMTEVLDRVGKESGFVSSGECTNRGCCVEVCDDHAMEFSNRYSVKGV